MSNFTQGFYTPLPQNLSDSDSEKDITMEPVCGNYGNHQPKKKFEGNSFAHNGHLDLDSMIEDGVKVQLINSKIRTTAFIVSCLIVFLPVVIFLWVLPCTDSMTCPVKISNWEYEKEDVEFKGKVNVVHGLFKHNLNLAVLYEGSRSVDVIKNGAISFLGSSGAVAWDFHQEPVPRFLDCSMIDVDGNGFNDCLILDDNGLKAIETVSGTIIWHVHSHEPNVAISNLSQPVKLKDFNNDGITEFLCVYQNSSFLIICGKTGKALRNIKINCNISDPVNQDNKIHYSCRANNLEKFYEISVDTLQQKYQDPNFTLKPTKVYGKAKEEIYVTGNRKLIVNNNGRCPKCHSTVSLYDDGEKQLKTWNYKAYIMKPVTVSFQATTANLATLKGHMHGFILKLWEWPDKPITDVNEKPTPKSTRNKRSIPLTNDTSVVYKITERVLLLTFNNTDIQVINASMSDVLQVCMTVDDCQPDPKNQENSLLITDLDQDGSQELVSHTSSFTKNLQGDWHLMSYLKVFRLESEFPKLYKEN